MQNNARVVVTGNRGYIGSVVCDRLTKAGYQVVGVDLQDGLDYGDVVIGKSDKDTKLVHLGAFISVPESEIESKMYWENNVSKYDQFLRNNKHQFSSAVFASTNAVYDSDGKERPECVYGWNKLIGEQMTQNAFGVLSTCLRFANPVGIDLNVHNDDSLLGNAYPNVAMALAKCAVDNKPFQIHNYPGMTRDFFSVELIASTILRLLEDPVHGIFDLGSGIDLEVIPLLQSTCDHFGIEHSLVEPPAGTAKGTSNDIPEFIKSLSNGYDEDTFIRQVSDYITYYQKFGGS